MNFQTNINLYSIKNKVLLHIICIGILSPPDLDPKQLFRSGSCIKVRIFSELDPQHRIIGYLHVYRWHHLRIKGTLKLLTIDIVSFESKENNLQELGEDGDGSEVGGCIEDEGLLNLDHHSLASS